MSIYRWLRPAFFSLDPEAAHALSLALLRIAGALPPTRWLLRAAFDAPPQPVQAFGLTFPNPLGLAAGYDKDAVALRGLACLGFGHLELGTVTPEPQPGNPRPRVFRLGEDASLINRLGFPSAGAQAVARRLRGRPPGPIIGVNLGKQRDTGLARAAEDYERLVDVFAPLADYLVINVSSPNTPELRRLQQREALRTLLQRVVARRNDRADGLGCRVPLLVKLAPDLADDGLSGAIDAMLEAGIDGVVATNTTIDRPALRSRHASESGGLSGAALCGSSTEMIRRIHRRAGDALPIVACGGVRSVDDAREKLQAGACLVQLYTGLVYEGPGLVPRIVRGLANRP